ncbi:MAG: TetR/AcrR family transcriptional regulator, partial [Pseudomonas alloputida]
MPQTLVTSAQAGNLVPQPQPLPRTESSMTLEVPAHRLSASGKPAGRIRQKNEQAI